MQQKGKGLRQAVKEYHAKADGPVLRRRIASIWSSPTRATSVLGQELPALVADGYTSFKMFMTYEALKLTDLEMLEVLSVARETGALVMVHAENYDAIRFLTERLERAGKTKPAAHALSRPIPVEREATHRAISLAELIDVPIMIVHVSNRRSDGGNRARAGARPEGLWRDLPAISGADRERPRRPQTWRAPSTSAARRRATPRASKRAGRDWSKACSRLFSSDHCPFRYDDTAGQAAPARAAAASAGCRTAFPASRRGCRSCSPKASKQGTHLARTISSRSTSTNHAKTYGLYPKKGTIAVGSDADIAIWDPERRVTISRAVLHDGCDYTPYEGREVTGWPVLTMVRGKVVVRDGKLVGAKGFGAHLARERSPFAAPLGRLVTSFEPAGRPG